MFDFERYRVHIRQPVLCIGDLMLDESSMEKCHVISPEAPAQ